MSEIKSTKHDLFEYETGLHFVHKVYLKQRDEIIDRIMALGKKFSQRTKTLNIAIELLDRYFLDPRSSEYPEI